MGTTYTGKKIKDTYKSIIKISDNSEADANGKQLSDGNGNDLGVYVDTDGVLGIGAAASVSLDVSSKTDAIHLPKGTTTDRGSITAISGMVRFNTSTTKFEVYDGAWRNIFTESGGTISGDLTVTGDLTVNGTTTTINTETVEFEDNILQLNTTQGTPDTATATTSGISIYRGDGVTQASFIFDDNDDTWDLTNNLTVDGNVGIGTTSPQGKIHIYEGSSGQSSPNVSANTLVLEDDVSNGLSILTPNTGIGSIFFGDDNDNFVGGFRYDHSNDSLDVNVNNATALSINSTRNVGIGTTSPVEKLYVNSTSGDARIGLNAPTGSDTEIKFSNNGVVEYSIGHDDATDNFVIGTANVDNPKLVVNKSGNVGIGTASPAAALDVKDVPSGGSGTILNVGLDTSNPVRAKIHTETYNGAFSLYDSASIEDVKITTSGYSWFNGGNLGIGTTSPDAKLHLYENNSDASGGGLTIEQNGSGDAYMSFLLSGVRRWVAGVDNSDSDKFKISNTSELGSSDLLVIDTSGNVGIGTTSPTQKLHVDGNARVTGAIYDSTNSAGTSGQILTSTGSGTNWSNVGSMSTLRLRSAASQNADATTDIAIQWDTQEITPDSSFTHSTTGDNSRIQVTNSGKYLVTGYLNYNGNTNNYRFTSRISIRVNGSTTLDDFFDGTYVRGSNGIQDHGGSFNLVVDLSANDYIEVLSKRTSLLTGNATIANGTNISLVRLAGVKGEKGDFGGVTISNFGDNRIITSSSTADNANAENNLTFDGSKLVITGDMEVTDHVHAGQGVLSFSDTGNKTLDASLYGVFVATGNIATATYTINNLKSGQVIDIVFTGTLSSAVITLDSGFTTDTFYQLGATTFNTSSQNHIQLVCIDDTDSAAIINYSVANFTGSNDVNP